MEVEIEKMVFAGSGLAHLDYGEPLRGHDQSKGKALFVRKVVPGDIVEVKLVDEKKDFAFGVVEKVIKPSEMRIDPPCKYFYQCGGCEHQNISYQNQLKIKEELVGESLLRNKIDAKVLPIIAGSDKEFFYRNSIRYMFLLDNKNQIQFARHGYPDDRELVAVDRCLLQSEKSNLILEKLRQYINKNIVEKKSLWQLKIREGKRTGDVMVEIITSSDDLPGKKGIVDVLKQIDGIKSIYHTITPAKSLLKLRRRLIFGSPVIQEKIGSYTFQISPESFFQTNSEGVKTLYDKIKEFANVEIGDEIVDLYCGTGSIGIYLSTLAKKVTGIEVVPEAIRDAKDNAKINKITNCEFICSDISNLAIQQYNNCILILDPPRAGLSKDLIGKLTTDNWKRLIYTSCNPATFARDLKYFMEKGITAKKIQPIDMFPQTHHTELVAELLKKD
ncbi:MAG: 23S rRNA (uracil(1939)-C(5))-methyltransferase RlmD [Candidatus Berkelbacteria bacterium]|nr:23S rRNA (uracil(1939)-C(5))-methyltransferase RlmD [Candidatus Berkelbacteria bacterium]